MDGASLNYLIEPGPEVIEFSISDPNQVPISGPSIGDVYTIIFDEAIAPIPVSSTAEINSWLVTPFDSGLELSGNFENPFTLKLTITGFTGSPSVPIPGLTTLQLDPNSNTPITNTGLTSLSSSDSALLTGSYGTRIGPSIIGLIASGDGGSSVLRDAGDTVTLIFNEATNQAGADPLDPDKQVDSATINDMLIGEDPRRGLPNRVRERAGSKRSLLARHLHRDAQGVPSAVREGYPGHGGRAAPHGLGRGGQRAQPPGHPRSA